MSSIPNSADVLAIDSKLRGCDIVKLRVRDVAHGEKAVPRATVMQQKTGQPVKFELTEQTREAVEAWITKAQLTSGQFLSRLPRRRRHSLRPLRALEQADYGFSSWLRGPKDAFVRRAGTEDTLICAV